MAENPEEIIRLSENDVKVGVALPWSTFDKTGRLLLRAGAVITSRNQLNALLDRGMYRQRTLQDQVQKPSSVVAKEKQNPFIVMGELLKRCQAVLQAIADGQAENSRQRVEKLCADLATTIEYDADAALAAMHLDRDEPYSISHSLYCGMVAHLIAGRLGYDQDAKSTVMAAAFTANVGMLDLQEQLLRHEGPLTEETWAEIRRHPEQGA